MKYDPEIHHRSSIRLHGYDYSQAGAYFVTICTFERECLFGEIVRGEMLLNGIGQIVQDEWIKTEEIRKEITLDEFIVMPNHLHGVIVIKDNRNKQVQSVGTHGRASLQRRPKSIGSLIAGFKSAATTRINESHRTPRMHIWQPRFHDRIIRSQKELESIRKYIRENPLKWDNDENNPSNLAKGLAGSAFPHPRHTIISRQSTPAISTSSIEAST